MSDWSIVGYASHPIPGDPESVDNYASYYDRVAEAIADTAASLRNTVSSTDVESLAIAEFKELALQVASSVGEIDERYAVVAGALHTYAGSLESARHDALLRLAEAEAAESERASAASNEYYYRAQLDDPATPPANLPHLQQQVEQLENAQVWAQTRIASASHAIQDLVSQRATAAEQAASAIRECVEGSDLNDTFWDQVADVFHDIHTWFLDVLEDLVDAIDAILPILDIITTVLAIVSLILILSGVGAAVGVLLLAVLGAISVGLKLLKAQAVIHLAVAGRRSFADAFFATVDAGISLALLLTGLPGATTVKPIGEALLKYLVEDRVEDFVTGDLLDYSERLAAGESISLGEVLYDAALTSGEQELIEAGVESVDIHADLVASAANGTRLIGDAVAGGIEGAADALSAPAEAASRVLPGGLGEMAGGVDQIIDGAGHAAGDASRALGDGAGVVLDAAAEVEHAVADFGHGTLQTITEGGYSWPE